MTNKHRDDGIDRLLRALQRDARSSSSPACLDAEILAAWFDNSLPDSARANAEAHAASCSRCQVLLAAMARTSEAGSAAAPSGEQPSSLFFRLAPWIAAVGTAVVAVAVWVGGVPESGVPRTAPSAVQAPAEAPKEKSDTAAAPAAQSESERRTFADRVERSVPPAGGVAGRTRSDAADPAQNAAAETKARDALGARQEITATGPSRAAAPSSKVEGVTATAPASVPGTPLPGAATVPPSGAAAIAPPPVPPLATPVKERVQESQRMADLRRAEVAEDVMLKAGQRGASWVLIPSPDSTIEWRIMNRLSVERSTDGGATWTRSTGAESPLNAGSSPSPAVCWVVGARGSVLVTTDSGRTWQRVPFPEQSNLVRVIATSADAAAVTAENGRTFTTSDRGGSWK